MKITKYEHACLVVEDNGKVLVIDPGVLAKLPLLNGVEAIFITHIHGDHLDLENIKSLVESNPGLKLIGSEEVLDKIKNFSQDKILAETGNKLKIGEFEILVGGNDHAVIYQKSPCLNRSLIVNGKLYYPGDSFALPTSRVGLVAVPVSAPWLKTSEYMEFIKAIKAEKVFPTHNGLLSEFGEETIYNWMSVATEEAGTELLILKPGESLEA